METCYVCLETMDIEKLSPYVCHKNIEGEIRYRHLWHGVPGITHAVGGKNTIGFVGYAKTLAQATKRALYYLDNNPYAAPEVKEGERAVLEAIKFEGRN